jgi:hypothetical protein
VRNLFLALLLANLLFLAWRYWVAPGEVPAAVLLAPGKEPTLQAFGRGPAADPRIAASASPGGRSPRSAVPADSGCMRIGPLAEGVLAQRLGARLSREGFDATTQAQEGQIWVGHWVQLESFATREEADRVVARLTGGGLPDVYVLQASPPFSISLGVFRDRAKAEKVAAIARNLGFRPKTNDRFRPGTQYWVSVVVPPGRTLPLQALGQESGQILRAEPARCAPGPDGGLGVD